MTGDESIAPSTARRLLAELARTQRDGRLPSVVAGVTRGGNLVWSGARGTVDGAQPGPFTQYRIGSITKTMTAVAVLRLRDEGLLGLDDPIEKHVPGLPFGERTVGQLLAHESGLRAELPGDWWERVPGVGWSDLAARLRRDDVLYPAGRRFHYSNLGYAVLGEVVARLRGCAWFDVLQAEVLNPLGMLRTSYFAEPGAARGWAVHPWADLLLPEPTEDSGAGAAAGQLWSTVADLGRFAGFLLGSRGGAGVLATSTVAEMAEVTGVEAGRGRRGYGLGVFSYEIDGGAVVIGHGGSMPGFVAGLFAEPAQQTGAVVLANATNGNSNDLAMAMLRIMRDHEPYVGPSWKPLEKVDEDALALTGTWYWGPSGTGLRLTADGDLVATGLGNGARSGRFRRDVQGRWVGLEGYHAGETLRPVRDAQGRVVSLDIGTFAFTRTPYDPTAPVPGGVDREGWRPYS
ncbi:serine hydrolase domain-containing protein [Kineosporia sp. NBRC 101731]|uniref:serine hydrolase domain-containing protein n=1 Tax=Kineosporia sp. NBRC 101731 TaxID=3032199 RepID=UPI0025537D01|nr:serine hydrolase domain-containing protein [Kineosporia sp. NBRC 101731]